MPEGRKRIEIVSKSAKKTQKVAGLLATEMKTLHGKKAVVVALTGDLGSGKTTFTQGFAEALGVKEKVLSPTFVLMKIYRVRCQRSSVKCYLKHLIHIDCYRIDSPREIEHLGLKKVFKDKDAIILIEWADRIKRLLLRDTVWIKFKLGDSRNERILQIQKQ